MLSPEDYQETSASLINTPFYKDPSDRWIEYKKNEILTGSPRGKSNGKKEYTLGPRLAGRPISEV